MKKEYMRPELNVLSLVVKDNTNAIGKVKSTTFNYNLDDSVLSVALNGNGLDFTITNLFN